MNNKAPAGYGLGANASAIPGNDLNNAILGGFYVFSSAVQNIPSFMSGKVLVMPYTNLQYYTQIAFSALTSEIAFRFCNNGVWGPWEYLNPLLSPGVEYRTAERYNGKPVYVMAVDGGTFPDNSTKTIEVQIPDASGQVKMLDCYGVLDNGTQIPGLYGSPVFAASNYLGLFTQNGPGKFGISVGSGRAVGLNFTLFLKYWKE